MRGFSAGNVCPTALSPTRSTLETRNPKLETRTFEPLDTLKFTTFRHHMVESQLRRRGIRDERVLSAMARVPRHEFVADPYRAQAYDDNPLPIGEGQTISQPYIVALMLELLDLHPEKNVLEIGTGSGYQTALLAELSRHVYSVERHAALAGEARSVLNRLGYTNVTLEVGDGSNGLPAHAPFDRIIVSAAAPGLPQALFDQLTEGGRLIVPVGPSEAQLLQLVTKTQGRPVISEQTACRFVPLIGQQGYDE
jgi:protein-L-isoaspartate(D-aspartate) O-methyltransferase